ncbi:hypothetical protein PAXRUDRAFT_153339 [Paxillus rubicundulus Ve08.2h10]|uniref:Uncharacterized protein n=1 Tax=Paxillus rubicundulus Ve08.2h10 TaxID=930991 RepID=A0A0D0CJX7_9AGAM|nr:hypothetical protein PAXRUDRAFT_153339 [Paxillus rubicundulus Ve08.2h10]
MEVNSPAGPATGLESVPNCDYSFHVKLGSMQDPQLFQDLEESCKSDVAFTNFCLKLNVFLNILLPGGKHIQLMAIDEIIEHHFLHVNFESLVDWKLHTDYLRCSPSFYNAPRHDYVIVDSNNGPFFACLMLSFTCQDEHLGFWRTHAQPWSGSIFISCWSIIHGVMVVLDFDDVGDYLVVDGVDTDMFLRVGTLCKKAGF